MPRTNYRILTLSLAGTLLCGISFAQQTSAPSTNPPAASPTTPAAPKTQTAPAAKPGATAATKAPAAPLVLKTQKEKASYAIGMDVGKNMKESFKKNEIDVNSALLARGLRDALAGNKPLLTEDEAKAVLTALNDDVRKRQQELHDAALAKNLKVGQDYLAANKDKPGVVVLPSGLQYKILKEGTGPKPAATDTVLVNYSGKLINGTEFDSSYKRGQPAKFPVGGGIIKGWTEALQLMPVGSKWELVIPSNLAYGEAGTPRGGPIGPNETLIFEVELISIEPKPEPKPVTLQAPAVQPQPAPQATTEPKPQAAPQAAPQAPADAKPQAPPQAKPQ